MARQADGTVYINTNIDTQGLNNGIGRIKSGVSSLGKAFGRLGIAIGSLFAVKELVDFGKSALELGSDLQEVQNVVDVTFTTMSKKVDEFAKSAAKTAGLSETMAKQFTGTFGSMAKALGFAEDEAYTMSTALTQLTGDVASFYNLSQEEAYNKLKAVFSGETEGLKDLGVVMTEASLDAFAMSKGFGVATSKMTEQQKTALRYQFVMERLAGASGDYVRTLDGWANQTRTLQLNIDSLKATIGQGLINVFTPVLQVLNAVIERLAVLAERFKAFTENIMGIKSTKTTEKAKNEVEQLGENYQDVTDGLKKYENATKKASTETKRSLSPLDNLNNITSDVAENFSDMSEGLIGTGSTPGVLETKEEFEETEDVLSRIQKKFKQIFADLKKTDFSKYGANLSDFVVLSLDTIIEKIEGADWKLLGEKVGEFIGGIDWVEIIKKAFELKFNIWKAIAEVWFGAFEAAPVETAILTALGALKFTGLGAVLGQAIAGALGGTTISSALSTAFASFGGIGGLMMMDIGVVLGAGTLAEIGLLVGSSIIGGITAAIGGWSLGQYLYEVFSGEEIDMTWAEQFDAIRESFSDGTWKDALELWADDIEEGFKGLGDNIAEWWEDITLEIREALGLVKADLEGLEKFYSTGHISASGKTHGGGGVRLPRLSLPVPQLATGAVIPPNAPFMAMLGDQRNGTNIEAPLDTIKQAVAEVMANMQNNVTFEIIGDPHGMFSVMQKEATMFTKQTGKSAFPTNR